MNSAAVELLGELRIIARNGLLASVMEKVSNTSFGRTLEAELGIEMNSAKQPDYKGIEIKTMKGKGLRSTKKTLFSKVPNWDLSSCNGSKEILRRFGYWKEGSRRLLCDTTTQNPNSHGLMLRLNRGDGFLEECHVGDSVQPVATWVLEDLHSALMAKHAETFWVRAKSHRLAGREYFELIDVLHTASPTVSKFDMLLHTGKIIVEHSITERLQGGAAEKGPFFRIDGGSLRHLFPIYETLALR